jgi:hypothetical protein
MKITGGCWMHANHLQASGDGRPSRRESQILCRVSMAPGNRDAGDSGKGLTVENTFKAEQRQMCRPVEYMMYIQAASLPRRSRMEHNLGHPRTSTREITQPKPTH